MADNVPGSDLWNLDIVNDFWNIEGLAEQDSGSNEAVGASVGNENILQLDMQNSDTAAIWNLDSSQFNVDIFCDTVPVENNVPLVVKEEFPMATSSTHMPSALPATSDWPGDYNFKVTFGPQEKTTKGVNWTYSKTKNKLYVGKDVPCPINFSTDELMKDVFIRATVLYSSPEHSSEVVQRCATHIKEESQNGVLEAEHFIRCESNMSSYFIDPSTKQHSVTVPFENPPAGQKFSTYIFKFACFGSCAGGPNRRSLMIIFTLEQRGQEIGRRKLELKVCACPGRDRKTEEETKGMIKELPSKRKDPDFNLATVFESKRKKPAVRNEKGFFTITTRDEGCYQFLREIKKMYSLNKAVNNLPPAERKAIMQLAAKGSEDASDS